MIRKRPDRAATTPHAITAFLSGLSPADPEAVEAYRALALGGILGLGAVIAEHPDEERTQLIQNALRDIDAALTSAIHDLLSIA